MERETKNKSMLHTWRQRGKRVFRQCLRAACFLIALYLIAVLIGLYPVNHGFEPTPDGIEVILISSSVHADVVLPINSGIFNWRDRFSAECFAGDTSHATHIAIGWGDKRFYVETPTWRDTRILSVANALFIPSATCLHVRMCQLESLPVGTRSVTISPAQYHRLVDYVERSFKSDKNGSKIQMVDAAYGDDDAFFRAHGSYHCLNTCNCWVGGAMKSAGIKTGWFTPLPKTIFFYLPD